MAAAIASSMRDLPVKADSVLIGEVGLSGELRMVGQMAATFAHEIGSPLQILSGRASALVAKPEDTTLVRKNAGTIVQECDRITRIVGQLLEFARRRPPTLTEINLVELLVPHHLHASMTGLIPIQAPIPAALPMITATATPGPYAPVNFAPFHLTAFRNPSDYGLADTNGYPLPNDSSKQVLDGTGSPGFITDVGSRIFQYFRNLVVCRLFYFHNVGYLRPQMEVYRPVAFKIICNEANAKIKTQ
jgi:hypothetical protein